jgi:osmotically-inducible protein OsmY
MQIQHDFYKARRLGSLGALLGCLIAATGCASDQEARRNETTTAREHRHDDRDVAKHNHDHDRDGVREDVRDERTSEAMNAREAELNENVAVKPVPIAGAADARDADARGADARDDAARGNTDADRQLASRIREAIVADDALSTKAKNVEIISNNGAVTLRGPVSTAEEKSRVASIAQNQAGAKRVTNQIEVIR